MSTKPKRNPPIWCDHCRAEISPAGIRSCIRQSCQTKAILKERTDKWQTTLTR